MRLDHAVLLLLVVTTRARFQWHELRRSRRCFVTSEESEIAHLIVQTGIDEVGQSLFAAFDDPLTELGMVEIRHPVAESKDLKEQTNGVDVQCIGMGLIDVQRSRQLVSQEDLRYTQVEVQRQGHHGVGIRCYQ